MDAVSLYTKAKLTYDSDKMIAISSVAQTVHEATADEYLLGLWRHNLERQLCWRVDDEAQGSYAGALDTRAPSWSWMSVNGTIRLPSSRVQEREFPLIKIGSVATTPIEEANLSAFQDRKLEILCGLLIPASEGPDPVTASSRKIIFAGKVSRWVSSWDLPASRSEMPREPFYCLPVIQADASFSSIRGLMVKQCADANQEQFRRIGSFEIWKRNGREGFPEAAGSALNELRESINGASGVKEEDGPERKWRRIILT